jgi:hypothetical protein
MKECDDDGMAAVDVKIGENNDQTCIGPLGGNAIDPRWTTLGLDAEMD